jgi:glycine/D-amino acid oxidase-like deaminating enzyme
MDTMVIGGGLAGLVAANLLADAGARVTLRERGSLGGRARSATRDGVTRNLGAHALYRKGDAIRVLAGFGIAPTGATPQGPNGYAVGGEVVTLPGGIVDLVRSPILEGCRWAFGRWIGGLAAPSAGDTVADWLDRQALTPAGRQLAEAVVRVATYTHAPDRLCAVAVAEQLSKVSAGVLYVDGGWQVVVDALEARARAHGVRIETHAGVEQVRPGAGGVDVDGTRVDAVVAAVPPRTLARLMGQAPPETCTTAAACLDLVVDAVDERAFVLGGDVPFYLSDHSRWARLAPEGRHVVHALAYLAPGERGDRDALEAWLDQVWPAWRRATVDARWAPRMVVAEAIPTPEGRPGLAVAPGVVGCGDSWGDRGMLADAACASAEDAVRRLIEARRRVA